ncbi:MAG: exopolygalacturonase [Bacteroidales bacterium]|nr:exopolygalacturonase [Bacteroidales bacterium]
MKIIKFLTLLSLITISFQVSAKDLFPDGSPISNWFYQNEVVNIKSLGQSYLITDYGVIKDSTLLQTEKIQAVIDKAHEAGGGVIIIPEGVYLSGALFFRPKTHLHLKKGAVLKGSDDIRNFPIRYTRIEGQNLDYFTAFINADKVDGFTLSGEGTIDGNGLKYWESFWLRREFNPKCTNLDEMRPRLVYISNSKDVQLSGVHLVNSPFWTTHLYKCENVKLLNLSIFAPSEPVKAPSSDGIDIDVCTNVHIKNCFISVNDDGIALKGGKGPLANKDENNGSNRNILIEDCTYGFCHSVLTCGSESIHNHNILLRRCTVNNAKRLLWLKMRTDTPQNYEYITFEDIRGNVNSFLYVKPWNQFFDMKGIEEKPFSRSSHITMRNINIECNVVFDVRESNQYKLSDFTFENLDIIAKDKSDISTSFIANFKLKNIIINGEKSY